MWFPIWDGIGCFPIPEILCLWDLDSADGCGGYSGQCPQHRDAAPQVEIQQKRGAIFSCKDAAQRVHLWLCPSIRPSACLSIHLFVSNLNISLLGPYLVQTVHAHTFFCTWVYTLLHITVHSDVQSGHPIVASTRAPLGAGESQLEQNGAQKWNPGKISTNFDYWNIPVAQRTWKLY